eukprot:CAMPEP_0206309040 /NCGR_PEP_ID=MMETSP0106_2-20121207/12175_1 /ASSEMBLY_ACC=CAM_ASM_000206 /TAXON_ID=81532 /ORGANISM="Acanthoeca-like sp., Strain 10tr" /LENGTH=104 /DNA_ID=CAMNT_0053740109 /DNA_START=308 /DNA_END=623 /DNA_ORIENTATION=+
MRLAGGAWVDGLEGGGLQLDSPHCQPEIDVASAAPKGCNRHFNFLASAFSGLALASGGGSSSSRNATATYAAMMSTTVNVAAKAPPVVACPAYAPSRRNSSRTA